MLYSEVNNFVFIHVPKAAGTSVIVYLKKIIPDLECIGRHHNSVSDITNLQLQSECPCGMVNKGRVKIPDISMKTTIFLAVLRDPVDIWQSHYNWGIQKTGLYKETSIAGIYNLLYKLKGSSRSAYSGFNDFLLNSNKKVPKNNRFYNDHLGTSLEDRLRLNEVFPWNLHLINSTDLNTVLPLFIKQVLHINPNVNIENKNRANYKKLKINPPAELLKKEKWFYNNKFKPFLFNPISDSVIKPQL